MRISVNLATRPFADAGPAIKRLRIGMAALALVAIGLGLGLRAFHQKAEEARGREHLLDQKIAAITQERQGFQDLMHKPANADVLAHAGALNLLFDLKSFSWTLAMEDLETVLPGGVQVSTIEPIRAKDGQITLHLRVIGPRDRAVGLVQNLEHSKHFLLPRIVGENSESTGGPGEQLEPVSASNRVNFDLLAEYNPAFLNESNASSKSGKSLAAGDSDSESMAPAAAHSRPGSVHSAQVGAAQRSNRPTTYGGISRPPAVPPSKPKAGGPR